MITPILTACCALAEAAARTARQQRPQSNESLPHRHPPCDSIVGAGVRRGAGYCALHYANGAGHTRRRHLPVGRRARVPR